MTIHKKQTKGRILFMGLDGAGKTTLIHELQRQVVTHRFTSNVEENQRRSSSPALSSHGKISPSPGLKDDRSLRSNTSLRELIDREPSSKDTNNSHMPTMNMHSQTYQLDTDRFVQVVDLPGRRALRSKWTAALLGEQLTHPSTPAPSSTNTAAMNPPIVGIVFVIDASDMTCFPLVAKELVHFQKVRDHASHLQKVPVILILNKIDHWGETTSSDKRKASRMVRQELKKCLEYQLLVDVKRSPRAYAHLSVVETIHHSASKTMSALINGGSSAGSTHNNNNGMTAAATQQRKAIMNEALSNCTLTMMTFIMESCAHDPDHIRMLHLWLKEEVSKVWKE